MAKKNTTPRLTDQEKRLLEQLRAHPQMMERFESILALTDTTEGALKTADEVEEQLIEEVRLLGHTTLSQWAVRAEQRVSQEFKAQQPEGRSRKKKGSSGGAPLD